MKVHLRDDNFAAARSVCGLPSARWPSTTITTTRGRQHVTCRRCLRLSSNPESGGSDHSE